MPIRTDAAAVAGIVEVDEDIDLTPFIEAGSFLVDRVVAVALNPDGSDFYTTSDLELIERWLSAHFYAIRDPRSVTISLGRIMERFESEVDLGLNVTRYGQQAMMLDVAGGLANLNTEITENKGGGSAKCAIHWLGTSPSNAE